jgi:hypothetical protein
MRKIVTHKIGRALTGLALIVTLPLVAAAAWGQEQDRPARPHGRPLAGAIVSVSENSFVLTGRGGQSVTVQITPDTRIIGRRQAALADIQTGDAVRIVARKAADGSLTARIVQDVGSGSQAPVHRGGGVWETRSGTVVIGGSVTGSSTGGVLTVASPDGKTTPVTVPNTARISRLVTIEAGSLTPGTHVFVRGATNADGSVTASVVFVAGAKRK